MDSASSMRNRSPLGVPEFSYSSQSVNNIRGIKSRNRSSIGHSITDPQVASRINAFYLSNVQSSIPFETDAIGPAYGIGDMIAPEMNDTQSLSASVTNMKKENFYSRPNVSSSSILLTIKRATSSQETKRDRPLPNIRNSAPSATRSHSTPCVAPGYLRTSNEAADVVFPHEEAHFSNHNPKPNNGSPLQKQVVADLPFPLPVSDEEQLDWIRANEDLVHSQDIDEALEWAEYVLRFTQSHLPYLQTYESENLHEINYLESMCENALYKIREFSELENAKAMYFDAYVYETGAFDVESDIQRAWDLYSSSANLGYTRSLYRLGVLLEDQGNLEEAVEYFEKGVSENDSACCWRLSLLILEGMLDGVGEYAHRHASGLELLERSADTADADVPSGLYSHALVNLHEHPGLVDLGSENIRVPIDEATALKSFAKAAFLGHSSAQLRMGAVYEFGKYGCPVVPRYSLFYYSAAAKRGETEADLAVAKWYLNGSDGIPVDEDLAFMHAERASMAGNANAQFLMGYLFDTRGNTEQATYWYNEAAKAGHSEAIERLALLENQIQEPEPENITSSQYPNQDVIKEIPVTASETSPPHAPAVSSTPVTSAPPVSQTKVTKVSVPKKTSKKFLIKHNKCIIS
ncbi:1,3-beta-glucan synthase regulatory factor Chf3/Chr4 [Schizosaccharomyces pombe]|uniref:Chitin synthase regulatory factor 4 n=1 Tax=Schizosaccharomyces pombe (strain 972 / ATCC 24843) TaxID=284812 RepID=CHR4_SCHPO|nr:1,3-beta-glucan synthase regulatory factor Chf3/Chr4 [Schizosaccharomyces pombe]O94614.4 RecName: Full=Chitin synthase regulatory factor 4; AltName: Full=Chs four homolog 3 [Schizosaccharomyces pombe 972h-]CAB51343.2 1,3-beta-glucan synthase regulatory factor Chf3/Chr4 [Schizosaccharomyces pombe]|eukprot:NP_596825.2 1,3-beta-glucan synthase regulatory factor Chf3/Chr4 [Schizosaccharomyces pombe]